MRIAVIASSPALANHMVESLREREGFEVAVLPSHGNSFSYDVIVAEGLPAGDLPAEGPPVILIDDDDDDVGTALGGRVHAALPADFNAAELIAVVEATALELTVLTSQQAKRLLRRLPADHGEFPLEALTAREREVLRMLADGLGNKEIADKLNISDHTAKFHVAQILAKLRAGSRAEAVAIGMRRGLVPI